MIINLLDWDITYTEFVKWVTENGVDVYAIAVYGARDPRTRYRFENEEDFVAFKLAFAKEKPPHIMNYKGRTTVDAGLYYAPFVPVTVPDR